MGRGGEGIARPGCANTVEIVADEQGSAALAEVPGMAGFEFFGAHAALEMRH